MSIFRLQSIVSQIGDAQRAMLHHPGRLLSLKMRKIRPEGIDEVQVNIMDAPRSKHKNSGWGIIAIRRAITRNLK